MVQADGTRPVFLAPHYDDVALSCGGTVAALASIGHSPLIITLFGGPPSGALSAFADFQHRRWGVGPDEIIATRRKEEQEASAALGAEASWLEIPDAIYRGERYLSDDDLFGVIHPDEADMPSLLYKELDGLIARFELVPDHFYVPLGVGNHVDHQHAFALGEQLALEGNSVSAYEDFPYAGEATGLEEIARRTQTLGLTEPNTIRLTEDQLQQRIEAVLCYRSQVPVIFRHQGDPAEAIRRYALGDQGVPVERSWPLEWISQSS